MIFLFADPSLRREVGSSASLLQYLLPELGRYGIIPLLCCHQQASPVLTARMSGQPLFRFGSDDSGIHGTSAQTIAAATLQDLRTIHGLNKGDCVYVSAVGLPQLLAVAEWLKHFPRSARPKIAVQLSPVPVGEQEPHHEGAPCTKALGVQVARLLSREWRPFLKLISFDREAAAFYSGLLQYPVEQYPQLQCATTAARVRVANTPTIAILGHQKRDKGFAMLPQFAASLLNTYSEAALLVHNNAPQEKSAPQEQEQLRALARSSQRLILVESAVGADIWSKFLDSADLLLIPGTPRHAPSSLLNEAIANGIPVVAPETLESAACLGPSVRRFAEGKPDSMFAAVSDVLTRFNAFAESASAARVAWGERHGAHRVVPKLLNWLSASEPIGKPANGHAKTHQPKRSLAAASDTRSKRILLSWYCDPSYIPPPSLSDNQVTVGPHRLATAKTYVSPNQQKAYDAYTPYKTVYDLKETLKIQGISGPFDLVVVFTESTLNNLPVNVEAFGCPTVFFLGDTHHGDHAIQNMLRYALSVRFDYVVTTYNRQHLHWLVEAGLERVAWIPALSAQHLQLPRPAHRHNQLAFIGQKGALHARRGRLLDALHEASIDVEARVVSRAEAAKLYSAATLSFNASLNGDLNLRTFEVMSAGGCLLTDRLTAESGQTLLFEEGREFVGYSSVDELIECVQQYLRHPALARQIAEAGHRTYTTRFLPEQQAEALRGWLFHGKLNEAYQPNGDVRATIAASHPLPLATRLSLYEQLQEAHRVKERVRVLISPHVPLSVASDMIDLPRVDCHLLSPSVQAEFTLKQHGLSNRIKRVESVERAEGMGDWDYLVGHAEDPQSFRRIKHAHYLDISNAGATSLAV